MNRSRGASSIWIPIAMLAFVVFAFAITRPNKNRGVFSNQFDLKPQLGAQMPIQTPLVDDLGKSVTLGTYLRSGRPVMLLPIFYNCSGVCFGEIDSLTKVLVKEAAVSLKKTVDTVIPGRDFDIVIVSVHPKETTQLANAKKAEIMSIFAEGWKKLPEADQMRLNEMVANGMHFTTGKESDVRDLTTVMGFHYTYDEGKNWVNHPAAAAYLAASGKITGYNTGAGFATKTLRSSVADAALGKVEPIGDVFLLGCFKMEASSPRTRQIVATLNTAAVITFLGLGLLIFRWNKQFPSDTLSTGGPTA